MKVAFTVILENNIKLSVFFVIFFKAHLSSEGLPYMPTDRAVSMVAAPEYVRG